MTVLVTPAEVEAELRPLARRLEARTDALAGLLRAAAEADVAYRLAYAKALLRAEGDTVSEREALATLATASELTVRKTTEAVADAAKESIRACATNSAPSSPSTPTSATPQGSPRR